MLGIQSSSPKDINVYRVHLLLAHLAAAFIQNNFNLRHDQTEQLRIKVLAKGPNGDVMVMLGFKLKTVCSGDCIGFG